MTREYRKTEKRIRAEFWQHIAPYIAAKPTDTAAIRESFHVWKDGLHRDGRLTDYQVQMITLGPDAPRKVSESRMLRRALHDLLADVTSGAVKNGGNPWSLDSVKAASLALTGDRFGFSSTLPRP